MLFRHLSGPLPALLAEPPLSPTLTPDCIAAWWRLLQPPEGPDLCDSLELYPALYLYYPLNIELIIVCMYIVVFILQLVSKSYKYYLYKY